MWSSGLMFCYFGGLCRFGFLLVCPPVLSCKLLAQLQRHGFMSSSVSVVHGRLAVASGALAGGRGLEGTYSSTGRSTTAYVPRSMEFTNALLQRLEVDSDQQSLAQLVEAAYKVTLKPWHGWISSAAYKLAIKLIPERKIFASLLIGKAQDCNALKDEIEKLAQFLQPFLDDTHAIMAKFRLDRLKST